MVKRMKMIDVLMKKRNGNELLPEEIQFVVDDYTDGVIPDYQMSAFLMAVFFREMTVTERAALTNAMMRSGDVLDMSDIPGVKVDKHSTGGVGDKTSLPLAAMVAALGVKVPMISGRGLGHTGGTLDKLEAIPGFNVNLTEAQFKDQVRNVGTAIISATGEIAPADKKIYALRDVTATVDSISLIASSIMSKKLATGNDALVLDVKTGSGAFMKTLDDSKELAKSLVDIGQAAGLQMKAVISDMNQPLGRQIGNALEIQETIETLKGKGPADLVALCLALGAPMVMMAGQAASESEARELLKTTLTDGTALETFRQMIIAQEGNPAVINDYSLMPQAKCHLPFTAQKSGVLSEMDADALGMASMYLGGGRASKDDVLDYGVGITMHKKLGDSVEAGETILTLHANREDVSTEIAYLAERIHVSDTAEVPPLIHFEM